MILESLCCPSHAIGILGGIRYHDQVYGILWHPKYPLSASTYVMYAVAPTSVMPPISQLLLIWHLHHASDATSTYPHVWPPEVIHDRRQNSIATLSCSEKLANKIQQICWQSITQCATKSPPGKVQNAKANHKHTRLQQKIK